MVMADAVDRVSMIVGDQQRAAEARSAISLPFQWGDRAGMSIGKFCERITDWGLLCDGSWLSIAPTAIATSLRWRFDD
jgi:hypothetical protein